ncbi:MAG: branched-chain amino acid ABC transporter permease [Actinomycetota bacterium]|nr:branched-chain amino acid ABC transporter permease [Actinomycetota bacterium]
MSLLATLIAQTDEATAVGLDTVAKLITALGRGLALGSIYALLALSFVLVFKATQAVNFAQGAIALVGTWFLSMLLVNWRIPARWLGDDLASNRYLVWGLALVAAVAMSIALGLIIERSIIRPMIGEPLFAIAVLTLGLEAVLRTVGNDALIGQQRGLRIPWGRTGFEFEGAFIYWTYIGAIVTAAAAFVATFLFFRTRTGIAMRAVAFDQEASMAQGIRVGRVFAIAWGAGAALAVLGAIFFSMTPFGNGVAETGLTSLAFRALPAVILGGLDSVPGALIGGLAIGLAEVFAGVYLAESTGTLGVGYQLVVPYLVMLLVLFVRPYGLFGTEEIRRV